MIIDSGSVETIGTAYSNVRKQHSIPYVDKVDPRKQRVRDIVMMRRVVNDKEIKCPVATHETTRCGRKYSQSECNIVPGCTWNTDYQFCRIDNKLFTKSLWVGAAVPVAYAITHFCGGGADAQKMWKDKAMFRVAYSVSLFVCLLGISYIMYNLLYIDEYKEKQKKLAVPLLIFFSGALALPVFQFTRINFQYSKYYIPFALTVTSVGIAWLIGKMLGMAMDQLKVNSLVVLFFVMFHVLVMDNIVWWQFLFSEYT